MSSDPSSSNLLSFSPSSVSESEYYDALILDSAHRAKLKVEEKMAPDDMDGYNALILAYNPESLSIGRSVNWESAPTSGNVSQQSYSGGGEDTLSVPVLLDGSEWEQNGGGSILDHIKYLHALSTPYDVAGSKKPEDVRPCLVSMTMGDMVFLGVLTKIDTSIEMFTAKGNPMRAVVTIGLKGIFNPKSITKGRDIILSAQEKAAKGKGGGTEETGEAT